MLQFSGLVHRLAYSVRVLFPARNKSSKYFVVTPFRIHLLQFPRKTLHIFVNIVVVSRLQATIKNISKNLLGSPPILSRCYSPVRNTRSRVNNAEGQDGQKIAFVCVRAFLSEES
jgi:hypothetical protein